jgi:S1-C subfamily serine protease
MPDYESADVGLRVADVAPGGAAAKAGIVAGDLIVRLGGVAIEDVPGYAQALDELQVGATVQVVLKRDGAEVTLPVVVGTRNR